MDSAVIFQIQSGCIVALMFVGIAMRKNRKRHVPIMATVIGWDILLILQIELSRGAIIKASKAMTNAVMLNIHVSIAVLTVLLYFGLIYTGRKILKGETSIRSKHRMLGVAAAIGRLATFATSFFAV